MNKKKFDTYQGELGGEMEAPETGDFPIGGVPPCPPHNYQSTTVEVPTLNREIGGHDVYLVLYCTRCGDIQMKQIVEIQGT